MLKLGWPKRISSTGGIYVDKTGKSNIADTQSAVFEYDNLNCVWHVSYSHMTLATKSAVYFKLFAVKLIMAASTMKYDFIPHGKVDTITKNVVSEK